MPIFNAKFFGFDFDKGKASATLDREIKSQIKQMGLVFARTAAKLVPVRTGFARGTFRNIFQAANVSGGAAERELPADSVIRVLRQFRREGFSSKKHTNITSLFKTSPGTLSRATGGKPGIPIEYYRDGARKILKTPQTGRQFATQPGEIFGNPSQGIYTFNFNVAISYFNINEANSNPRTPSAPWRAVEVGRATALNWLKTVGLQRLPKIIDFFSEVEYSSDGTSTSVRKNFGIFGPRTKLSF